MNPVRIVLVLLFVLAGCGGGTSVPSPTPPKDSTVAPTDATEDTPTADRRPAVERPVLADLPAPADVADDGSVVPADDAARDGETEAAACSAGQVRCGDACIDSATNVLNCGACAVDCRALPGVAVDRVSCAGGTCRLNDACLPGRGDCDGTASNGCETDLSTASNCGRCGSACAEPTPVCAMVSGDAGPTRTCTTGCTAMTPTRCAMACVDTAGDAMNCGGCNIRCSAPVGGGASCTSGRCAMSCPTGSHLCDGRCALDNDPNTCGGRCAPCPSGPAGSAPTCASGSCDFVCGSGLHRCGDACIPVTSTMGCGTSCSPCPSAANADPSCDGMRCGFTCRAGHGDCDGDPSNGCEANLSNVATCGRCGTHCTPPANATATCDGTSCGFTCVAEFHRCGDACVSNVSTASCGTACRPCAAPSNATATCDGTSCGYTCASGFTRCGSSCADTQTDDYNCGGCGRVCFLPHANSHCTAGGCVLDGCHTNYADCNRNPLDGCETNLWADDSCGSCGSRCPSAYSCLRGVCYSTGLVCERSIFFSSRCPDRFHFCERNSVCRTDNYHCDCNPGSVAVRCDGTRCSESTCNVDATGWWCQPVP